MISEKKAAGTYFEDESITFISERLAKAQQASGSHFDEPAAKYEYVPCSRAVEGLCDRHRRDWICESRTRKAVDRLAKAQ
jgi:hypothetical protein